VNEKGIFHFEIFDDYLPSSRCFKEIEKEFATRDMTDAEWYIELTEYHIEKYDDKGEEIVARANVKKKVGNI
jgi:hypothetical protein